MDPQLIPLVDLLVDPVLELFVLESVDDVGNVRSRKVISLPLEDRKGLHHVLMPSRELEHGFDLQSFEVGHGDDFYVDGLDSFPFAGHKVPKVEDGHCFVAAEVCTNIMGQESVDFSLRLVLGSETLRIHCYCEFKWVGRQLLILLITHYQYKQSVIN